MQLEFFGHACFGIVSNGQRCIIDPYDDTVGYKIPQKPAVVCLVSHDHHDHNNTGAVLGRCQVLRGTSSQHIGPFHIRGVLSDHDEHGGQVQGRIVLFRVEVEGVVFAHLADLNRCLNAEEIAELGKVDILMVPCGGGGNTIDNSGACRVCDLLKPAITIPMHYRTPFTNRASFPDMQTAEAICKVRGAERQPGIIEIKPDQLPSGKTYLMAHLG